jgi:ATP adenylyltransferase
VTGQFDQLWAGWRASYIESVTSEARAQVDPGEDSLFERLLMLDDAEGFIVHRGSRCSALLNAYPYTNGHLLVLPNRAVAALDDLDEDEMLEMFDLVRDAVTSLKAAYHCDGVNVGLNLGEASGAGVPDHLHAHVLPRWKGDTNFMTSIAVTRVLPESLDTSWKKLRDAWPQ